ncbi:hypothetical protein P2W68_01560 [Chryseobacterium arthrosphaerae]|uniref:hypothetical protein n=1 Tax=Chryseobacterium arthrosphaerae TaxID=651561 RepID=UPI0023E1DC43|nr:hypothetical protein [Chryseobacterium arthrosphaerae]WES98311.1 hypothetical protein P2W68_01560 [Chryseobacterium arthrosphaerae]
MSFDDKDLRLIRKNFENKKEVSPEKIRLGNNFVDDFIFDDSEAADIPINALRVIFNLISIISSEQFRPEDRPKQLTLFDEEFETSNNIFASIKIRNSKISPSGSTKQVIDAYEFLAQFKMGWYKSLNSKGKEIKTFGGLISTPSYDKRGYTTFLVSSYWLKKLVVIPEYNYVLYNLVYNVRNNKHIIFAMWLAKLPETGTALKLATLNKKFGLNYKTANDFCFKFLKQVRISLDKYNNLSFNYKYREDLILIIPSKTNFISKTEVLENPNRVSEVSIRLSYFRKRFGLQENEMKQFFHQYRNIPQTRLLIEKAFKRFIKNCRFKRIKSTLIQGMEFLKEIQNFLIEVYLETRAGKMLPNSYPIIL